MAERSKLASGILVLAGFGAFLFAPPLVMIFNQRMTHFGVPQIVIYLFAVWGLLVLGTAVLTHYLPKHGPPESTRDDG